VFLPLVAAVGILAVPALANAEISLNVPVKYLGAPLPVLKRVPQPIDTGGLPLERLTPAHFTEAAPPGTSDPFMPAEAAPSRSPAVPKNACRGLRPTACTIWGTGAAADRRAAPLSPQAVRVGVGQLKRPSIGTWLLREQTVLSWAKVPGATYYNVQVYQGRRRVMNSWPTGNVLKVPEPAIDQGRYYLWVVWPGFGRRSAQTFGPPIGRSVFGVLLRPRISFRPARGARGRTVAEVRPHIPYADVRLTGPKAITSRVSGLVRLNGRSQFTIDVSPKRANGLSAVLVDRGPAPPEGLNGPVLP
jgi:hypothetical protein